MGIDWGADEPDTGGDDGDWSLIDAFDELVGAKYDLYVVHDFTPEQTAAHLDSARRRRAREMLEALTIAHAAKPENVQKSLLRESQRRSVSIALPPRAHAHPGEPHSAGRAPNAAEKGLMSQLTAMFGRTPGMAIRKGVKRPEPTRPIVDVTELRLRKQRERAEAQAAAEKAKQGEAPTEDLNG